MPYETCRLKVVAVAAIAAYSKRSLALTGLKKKNMPAYFHNAASSTHLGMGLKRMAMMMMLLLLIEVLVATTVAVTATAAAAAAA